MLGSLIAIVYYFVIFMIAVCAVGMLCGVVSSMVPSPEERRRRQYFAAVRRRLAAEARLKSERQARRAKRLAR